MTTLNLPSQETSSSERQQYVRIMAVLFTVAVVFLAQGFLWRVVWRAQQNLLPPGSNVRTWAMSTLTLPALQTVTCALFLIPWALLGDRFGARLSCSGGMLLWALGALAGSWSDSMGFLLLTYALQAAGVAAVIPAALAVIATVQPQRGGLLTGLIIAFPALLYLPGSLIADQLSQSLSWRTSLLLVAVAAVPLLLLSWFTFPSAPTATQTGKTPTPDHRPEKRRAVVQTLLLSAALAGLRIHVELAFASHYSGLVVSDTAEYSRANSGLISFPFIAGLATGFVVGAIVAGRRESTRLAWAVTAAGAVIALIPPLPFDIASPTSAVLISAGLGFGLSGQLVALLQVAPGNRISRTGALFLTIQNLGYAAAVGLPVLLLTLALGGAAPEDRLHLFLGFSLLLLAAGLVLAIRSGKRPAGQRTVPHTPES